MKKIFIIYGHYDDKSFNASIRDEFIKTVKEKGHEVDCVDLYKEKFDPVFSGEKPNTTVLDHQKRIEKSDTIVLIAPIWNFRMPAIVEGWIDKVLAPPWAFRFKKICRISKIKSYIFFAVFITSSKNFFLLPSDTNGTAKYLL